MEKYSKFNRGQFLYLVLLLFITGYLVYRRNYLSAAFVLIATMVIFFLINSVYIFQKKSWDKFVSDSVLKLKESVIKTATESDFPIVMFTKDGIISWYNEKFSQIIDNEELIEIEDILDIDVEKVWDGEYPEFIKIEDRYFKPSVIKYTAQEDEFEEDVLLFYLTDVTEVKNSEDSKLVFMLIEVDNLTEVFNSTPEDSRPFISAEIEKEILSYATEIKGFMKKYSTNKYFIVAPYEIIRDEEKKKFPILEKMKQINFGNTIEPTISVGVSFHNGNVLEAGENATSAKELALGRGGDQVIVKRGEALTFYGGNSRELEKKSRVRFRVIAHALRDLMLESEHIYIMGHSNPDMDCLGAAVGIRTISRSIGKESTIIMDENHSNVDDLLEHLYEDEEYENAFKSSKDVEITNKDLLIIVDVHSQGYILNSEISEMDIRKVVIDHHRRAQDSVPNITLNYIETYASSTSELVTELIQYIIDKPKLKKVEANALLAGIWVDTKSFYYKTGVRTFEAASFLRKAGGSPIEIRSMFAFDVDTYVQKAEIIKNAYIENKVAIALSPEGFSDPLIAAQAADEFLNLKGIHTSFVLFHKGESVMISARSLGDINVQVIMEKFNGGGHMTMAGARVTNRSMEEVKDEIIKILRENAKEDEENESDTNTGR